MRFRRCVWKGESQHRQRQGNEPCTQPLQATCGGSPNNSIGFPKSKHGPNTQHCRNCHPYTPALSAAVVTGRLLGRLFPLAWHIPIEAQGCPDLGPLHGHRRFEIGCNIRCWNGCLQRAQGCWWRSERRRELLWFRGRLSERLRFATRRLDAHVGCRVPCPFHMPTRHEAALLKGATLQKESESKQDEGHSWHHGARKVTMPSIRNDSIGIAGLQQAIP